MNVVMTHREKQELHDAIARKYHINIDDPVWWGDIDPSIANNIRRFIEGYEYRCNFGNM